MTLKRFKPVAEAAMSRSDSGGYVKYDDYEKLAAALSAAENNLPASAYEYFVEGIRVDEEGRCEPVPDDEAHFWTIYRSKPDAPSEVVIDLRSREDAESVAALLAGIEREDAQ